MEVAIITGVTWGVVMTGYIIYKKISPTEQKSKIIFFNVTDRVVKGKKFKDSVNNRAKGVFSGK